MGLSITTVYCFQSLFSFCFFLYNKDPQSYANKLELGWDKKQKQVH
jgi:hypothetical protein